MKVLMVDDSAADRNFCRVLLRDLPDQQIQFFEETQGDSGLRSCREISPDCVLLDYRLPDMTGIEFLSLLQSDGTGAEPDFPVVMLTGVANEQVAVQAMRAGAQDYLVKDRITPEALSLAIQKATQKVGLIKELRAEHGRLTRSLAEKEMLIKEVHHRVKNNLQVIASLLRLQAESLPAGAAEQALRESQHRVEAISLIHEQLYQSEEVREINVAHHASLLLANLFHSYGVDPARIHGHAEIAPSLVLGINEAIPVGLILNELISNALKHAFPDEKAGSIRIDGESKTGRVSIAVTDDGIGMPADVETRKSKSLGLQIIKILTRQLQGAYEFERGNGTCCRISFPEK